MRGLGIDIGTTSICVVLFDNRTNEIISKRTADNVFLDENDYLQDPEKIVETVFLILTEWDQMDFAAIGISSQMHGILYIDKDGLAVSDFYTWKHQGGEKWNTYIQNKTGYPIFSGYASATHFALHQQSRLPQDAVAFVGIGDYLAMRLTGKKEALIEETMAASFGLYDRIHHCFCDSAIRSLGISPTVYPPVSVGKTLLGYYKNKPVYAAIGDNQASFLGAIADRASSIHVNVGTGSQISVFSGESNAYELQDPAIERRPFLGAGSLYVGASVNGGKAYERLAMFFQELCQKCTKEKVNIYEKMAEIAQEKPETDLQAVSAIYGKRGEEAKYAGFFGLQEHNFYPADFIISFVQGMATELWEIYQKFPDAIKKGKCKLVASGNGIRRNKRLKQEIEKIFDLPLIDSAYEEEAAVGACLLALQGWPK
jgi:sedoheptulokinase